MQDQITLSDDALRLVEAIESAAAVEITVRGWTAIERQRFPSVSGFAAAASIQEDGTPTLICSSATPSDVAVHHELFHLHRWVVDKVFALIPKEHINGARREWYYDLENQIEHVLYVVPTEIAKFPESADLWNNMLVRTLRRWKPTGMIRFDLIKHSLFVRSILSGKEADEILSDLLASHGLTQVAAEFAKAVAEANGDKVKVCRASLFWMDLPPDDFELSRWTPQGSHRFPVGKLSV